MRFADDGLSSSGYLIRWLVKEILPMPSAITNPFFNPAARHHEDGLFHREEVALANRNSGILLETLRHDVTPQGMHYLLNHFDVPFVPDPADWAVRISGAVASPLTVSLDEIKRLPTKTLRVTLECAGNGRSNMTPRWPSMPWMEGAVGTSDWTGTPLRTVLERAGLTADAVHVVFFGVDRGYDKIEHNYGRALTPDMAMRDDVLLVTAMNGHPLLPQHGYPLRLVVPGWYGMASVKWLDRIEVWDRPFDGPQQVATYVYKNTADDPGVPVTSLRVKALMVPPGMPDWYTRRRMVDRGPVKVYGRAWSGDGVAIERVEFGCDGHWKPATLDEAMSSKYAWRGWSCAWDAMPGDHELACRATDARGNVQPLEPVFDRGGFGNNTVHRVQVTVR
jgi:DMSO/TMAO reductase YedYZ molybdopterin-dependent catalytic subunit